MERQLRRAVAAAGGGCARSGTFLSCCSCPGGSRTSVMCLSTASVPLHCLAACLSHRVEQSAGACCCALAGLQPPTALQLRQLV